MPGEGKEKQRISSTQIWWSSCAEVVAAYAMEDATKFSHKPQHFQFLILYKNPPVVHFHSTIWSLNGRVTFRFWSVRCKSLHHGHAIFAMASLSGKRRTVLGQWLVGNSSLRGGGAWSSSPSQGNLNPLAFSERFMGRYLLCFYFSNRTRSRCSSHLCNLIYILSFVICFGIRVWDDVSS